MKPHRTCAGFTLIEVMVATAVTGILSSIAYPSFQGAICKARRTDAQVALMQLQGAEERYRSSHASYGSLTDLGLASSSPSRHYSLDVTATSASGYEVVASASGTQRVDAPCRHMKLIVDGANVAYASGPDASAGNAPRDNRQCWGVL